MTVRTSSSRPQAMSQPSPSGLSGWGRVRKETVAAAWRMASSRSAAVMPGGGGMIAVGVVAAGAVEAEQGVEVDGAACLVLGGLAVRQADRGQVFTWARGCRGGRRAG